MCTDEEAARRLHLEMNGFARRRRGVSSDLSKLAPVRAGPRNSSQSTDVEMSEAGQARQGEPSAFTQPLLHAAAEM